MEEKDFFVETEVTLPATLHCPSCRQSETYDLRWVQRKKKASLPPHAGEQDRRRFASAKSYSVRRDDMVQCKNMRCRKRFEVSGLQSVAFL
ncbi:MAG: hypothetical protein NTZ98_00600 [Acidobacteria bacterium]|jgi:hypothetical protein|nr:hypothetical protein [Acidobacteriota bacterium]